MHRIFVDMDGVIVDFDGYARRRGQTPDEIKKMHHAYRRMPAMPGAIQAVRGLIAMGFEIWIASKPPTGVAPACSDKAAWIIEHLPELKQHLILTPNKGLLGGDGDFLIDDRPDWANSREFKGELIVFREGNRWPQIMDRFRMYSSRNKHRCSAFPSTNQSCELVRLRRRSIAASLLAGA